MENNKSNWIFLLVSAIILAAVFLFVGLSVTWSLKNNQQSAQGITNTISVVGEGKASVAPDTLEINLSVSEIGKTTELAQQAANDKITKVTAILKAKGIPTNNIKTTNVSVYPEYSQVTTPVPVAAPNAGATTTQAKILDYRSQQSLSIDITGADFSTIGGDIINQIAAVGWVNVDSSNFILKDQTAAMKGAREKAFADAKAKAEQLASIGGVTLGRPVMITDSAVSYQPMPFYNMKTAGAVADTAVSTAPLSPGQSDVTIDVNVVFEIK